MSESKFIYIVYQTTNLINQKIYVGVHKQRPGYDQNTFDGYLGSGDKLLKAITKYGKSNFIRTTLFSYQTYDEAYKKETEIVNEVFMNRLDTYNISIGGFGYDCNRINFVECEWCNKMIDKTNYTKWHGDKCNSNPETKKENHSFKKKKCKYCGEYFAPSPYYSYHDKYCKRNPKRNQHLPYCSYCEEYYYPVSAYKHNQNCKRHPNADPSKNKLQCEYCKKYFDSLNYHRHHGEKCKENPLFNQDDKKTKYCVHCKQWFLPAGYTLHTKNCKENPNRDSLKDKIFCEYCKKYYDKSSYNNFHGKYCKDNPNINNHTIFCEYCRGSFIPVVYKGHHNEKCINNPNRKKKKRKIVKKTEKCEFCNEYITPSNYALYHGKYCVHNPNRNEHLVLCAYCNSYYLPHTYKRWHGERCSCKTEYC